VLDPVAIPPGPRAPAASAASLRTALSSVVEFLRAQLKLRHSLYYENQNVVVRIADVIAEGQPAREKWPLDLL
jgi:hypothetical protein